MTHVSTSPETPTDVRLYLSPPDMSNVERDALMRAFDSGWVAPVGPELDAFEMEFAQVVGTRCAVALSSGTAALHLALVTLGVNRGDDVLVSSLTFVATANVVRYVGANPIFIDSDQSTWNMDPELLEQELNARSTAGMTVGAVIVTDVFGQCADYDRIVEICERFGVPLIEDAAESLGARYQGRSAGSFGAIGCFSFNGNKMLTTSGGGMLVTNREDWANKVRHLATQAREEALHYQHSELGYNYRLSNLLAAVGRAQLSRLDWLVRKRRAQDTEYRHRLADLDGIEFMPEPEEHRSSRWLTCMLVDESRCGVSRDKIMQDLAAANVESRPVWKPMHLQPLYEACPMRGGAVSETLFRDGVCLPSGTGMVERDLDRVCELIRGSVLSERRP